MRYQGYNAQDRVIWSVDAEGYVSDYQRDSFGNAVINTRFAAQISTSVRDTWASAIANGQVEHAKALGEQQLSMLRSANNPQNRSILTDYDALGGQFGSRNLRWKYLMVVRTRWSTAANQSINLSSTP